MFGLYGHEPVSGKLDCLVQRNRLPRIGDLFTDHRRGDAILVAGIAKGKAALDAGVTFVRPAIFRRHHADDLVTLQFRIERAADAAVGAGCFTVRVGTPCSTTDFSIKVAVGHACTQAPQETHSELKKSSPYMPAETRESKPLP